MHKVKVSRRAKSVVVQSQTPRKASAAQSQYRAKPVATQRQTPHKDSATQSQSPRKVSRHTKPVAILKKPTSQTTQEQQSSQAEKAARAKARAA